MADQDVKYTMSLNDLVSPTLKNADDNANKFESTLNKITSTAGKMAIAVGIAFSITAVTAFASSVVDAGSKVENARTGLTTLLKDAATANEVIKNTMVDATRTPFAFEGLLSANKALISAGESAGQSRAAVLNLANAIAATGGGDDELQRMVVNLQQIRNTGNATAMDIKQFAFAGINVYKVLANEIYHTNNANAKQVASVKEVKVSYELLTRALASAHEGTGIYANGLENMAKNTSVQISNVGDAIFQFKVQIFDDFKPAIDYVISGTLNLINHIAELYNWAKERLPGALSATVAVLKDVRDFAYGAAIGIGAATLAYAIANPTVIIYTGALIANGIATVGLTIATYAMTAAQWLLNAAMTANPVGLIITGIGLLVGGLVLAYKHSSTFRAILSGIGEVAKNLWPIFKGLGEVIYGVVTFDPKMIAAGMSDVSKAWKNFDLKGSFIKGAAESLDEDRRNELAEKKGTALGRNAAKKTPDKTTPGGGALTKPTSTKVSGTKTVNIHITIGNLVKDIRIQSTTFKESVGKVQDAVTKALTSAVNDSQIVAGS